MKIALDGPAGAGKSTVADIVAEKLGIMHLDTGAMYRTVALFMLKKHITPEQADLVAAALPELRLEVSFAGGVQRQILNGEDVSQKIRENAVSGAASAFSALPCVRTFLVAMQQKIAAGQDCILDGRDIGTVVLPDADFKFFLTASAEERARRRTQELHDKGQTAEYESILDEIRRRDHNDSTRATSPLKQAEDAVLLDSTFMSIEEVTHAILSTVKGEK